LLGGVVSGNFKNAANPNGSSLRENFRIGGEGAFAMPIGSSPITIGLSVIPQAPLEANWRYADTDPDGPGGSLVSYGVQQHKSEILVLRSAFGISWKISDKFSIGASIGLVYNDNTLIAPYIFQTQPALAGLKTLLNLQTDGYGFDGTVGALWKPTDDIRVGVSYRSPSTVHSHGNANGDATVQLQEAFDPVPAFPAGTGAFHYDAEVINHFPQTASAGVSWKVCPRWRVSGQVDWIDWSDAFDNLRVLLSNGSNGAINGAVGSSSMEDQVPLRWRDQFIFRGGVEYSFTENWDFRGGYSYGRSPVPSANLLPLVAAVTEHTLGVGVGWHRGHYLVDFGYQYSIPAEQSVGTSALKSGEYSNSKTEVSIHAFALTGGIRF
jgi:long-subunit fatty acid transport protein